MVAVRSWSDGDPRVAVGSTCTLEWDVFREKGREGYTENEAPLEGLLGMVLHRIQPRKNGSDHEHDDREHICYFTKGRGKMKVEGEILEVGEGVAVHVPPHIRHQVVNDSDGWIEYIIVSGAVTREQA